MDSLVPKVSPACLYFTSGRFTSISKDPCLHLDIKIYKKLFQISDIFCHKQASALQKAVPLYHWLAISSKVLLKILSKQSLLLFHPEPTKFANSNLGNLQVLLAQDQTGGDQLHQHKLHPNRNGSYVH